MPFQVSQQGMLNKHVQISGWIVNLRQIYLVLEIPAIEVSLLDTGGLIEVGHNGTGKLNITAAGDKPQSRV